jgi:hypothetical protein
MRGRRGRPWSATRLPREERHGDGRRPRAAAARSAELAGPLQVHLPERVRRVPARHAGGHLFSRASRDFSSGCIRIERPEDFARLLLDMQTDRGSGQLDALLTPGTSAGSSSTGRCRSTCSTSRPGSRRTARSASTTTSTAVRTAGAAGGGPHSRTRGGRARGVARGITASRPAAPPRSGEFQITTTAAPRMRPALSASSASTVRSSGNDSTCVRTGTVVASARKSVPS